MAKDQSLLKRGRVFYESIAPSEKYLIFFLLRLAETDIMALGAEQGKFLNHFITRALVVPNTFIERHRTHGNPDRDGFFSL
jgi:hypothetical protein